MPNSVSIDLGGEELGVIIQALSFAAEMTDDPEVEIECRRIAAKLEEGMVPRA